MSRGLLKIVIPMLSLAVTLGLFFHFASNKNRILLEQSVSGTYQVALSDPSATSLLNLTDEDQNSIENLLHCALKVNRDPRRPSQIDITVTVSDSRPAIAVHRKAVDLIAVILKEQAVALFQEQLQEMARYRNQEKKLDWLESQERLIKNKLELAESAFSLEKISPIRSSSNALSTLIPMPFLTAAVISLILFLRGVLGYRTQTPPPHHTFNSNDELLSEDLLSTNLPFPESRSIFSDVFLEIERELDRSASKKILVLGEHLNEAKTVFTLQFARFLSSRGQSVHLVDFDLRVRNLSLRLGREFNPGISDFLMYGGPSTEFSSSLAGMEVTFTPAGQLYTLDENASERRVREYFQRPPKGTLLIEASKTSPLHLLIHEIEAVLYVDPLRPVEGTYSPDFQVLLAFREAKIPVWAVSSQRQSFFPMV